MRSRVQNVSSFRLIVSLFAMAVALATLAGCSTKGGKAEPEATATASPPPVIALGQAFTTRLGNRVTVYAFERAVSGGATPPPSGATRVAADVELCAGSSPTERTGSSPTLFFVETADRIAYRSVMAVKQPALQARLLAANECARGWATFDIPQGATPLYVVLISSQQAKWRIA